ncbi:spermatocyte protein spe-26-like [Xenia sp. Carnegie-2017]|uniref:spermatocyte protein spe-26-like n=1 Tax=Xenia sp. Carnegie-2017 TaxID=2897299 RepID=UPI001F04EBF8|nr:spermatocyte protein spe-26-like [Xenia sp. Carnegie-2017]
MAYRPKDYECGYDESRFKNAVDENFRCAICLNVVKDARMCQHNEHIFCRECIEEHLRVNGQTCPQCQDNLTVTKLHPARFVNNLISKFKISCDYANRGCPEFSNVEDLERHVENCGFAPVLCSNESCDKEINKRDKIKHETELCEYRKIPSHDFKEIGDMFQRSFDYEEQEKMQLTEITRKMESLTNQNSKLQKEMMESKGEIRNIQQNLSTVIREMMESSKKIKDVQQNLSTVTKEMKEMKAMMFQILGKMTKNEHVKTLRSSIEGMVNSGKEDILIAGGYLSGSKKSAEIFSWKEKKWFKIASMKDDHDYASSFIYNDNLFVVGGYECKSMETLNINQLPLTWRKFPAELPYKCYGHQTVVYKQQILLIGGYNGDKFTNSDLISEIKITGTKSHVLKELCHMPEPRQQHGAVVVDDKVLIFGGHRKDYKASSSVLEFDPRTLTFKEMPPLPHPLTNMAAVQWRNQVVVLGGYDGRKYLNSVIMYECNTGKITVLPSMLEKRLWCCAVITDDTIVVMGGQNNKGEHLKSVECFKMASSSSWTYLPSMNESRDKAIAEVLPFGQNYV